jgi:hypothetical protein
MVTIPPGHNHCGAELAFGKIFWGMGKDKGQTNKDVLSGDIIETTE